MQNTQRFNHKSNSAFRKKDSTMEFAAENEMNRRTPILHMQFDELASH